MCGTEYYKWMEKIFKNNSKYEYSENKMLYKKVTRL